MIKQRGFTLIETVLVIAVAATLLTLGYKQYQKMQDTKRIEALRGPVLQAKAVVQTYYNTHCNDLITDFVATNMANSGLSTSGLTLKYNAVSKVSTGFEGIKLPYAMANSIASPWLGEVKSEQGTVTLYLTLWVPYTEDNALKDLQTQLGASSYGTSYPNSGSKISNGQLVIWSWSATQEAAMAGNVRMGFSTAANTAFIKSNIPSFDVLKAGGGPVTLNRMSCALVPAWLQAANQ